MLFPRLPSMVSKAGFPFRVVVNNYQAPTMCQTVFKSLEINYLNPHNGPRCAIIYLLITNEESEVQRG